MSNADFKNVSAGGPRRVTRVPIGMLRRTPQSRTARWLSVWTDFCFVTSSRTFWAFTSFSPASPTPTFTTTFSIRISRMSAMVHLNRRDLRSLDRRRFRADDEHLPDVRGEAFRERDDVRPRVPGPLNLRNVGNLSDVLPRGHEDRRASAEFVVFHDLLSGYVDLQRRPGLIGVLRQDHVATVMEVHLRLAATDRRLIFHATQLPRRVPGFDPDEGHAPPRVDEHAIVRLRLVQGEDVHESDGELRVRHHPAVDEDPAIVQDVPRLPGGVAELEHVADRVPSPDRQRAGEPALRLRVDLLREMGRGENPFHMEGRVGRPFPLDPWLRARHPSRLTRSCSRSRRPWATAPRPLGPRAL